MCGRIFVSNTPKIQKFVEQIFSVNLDVQENPDLSPGQSVATVATIDNSHTQLDCHWGIKPAWSKRLLINAQAETVSEKKTFKNAFEKHRCLVPCSGWFEWKAEGGARKTRYRFARDNAKPLLMAAIYYPASPDTPAQMVTLTTAPDEVCAAYHHRMPLIIPTDCAQQWLRAEPTELAHLLANVAKYDYKVVKD